MDLKNFRALLLLLAIACYGQINAQLQPETETMKRMVEDARSRGIIINNPGLQDLGSICSGKKMRTTSSGNVISDISVVLLHPEMDRSYAPAVYDFIERYFLSLLLKKNQTEQLYLLREDMVKLLVNGKDFTASRRPVSLIVQSINLESSFSLSSDDSGFTAKWLVDNGNTNVELVFPKQYDLILGKDKKELSHSFRSALVSFPYKERQKAANINPVYFRHIPEKKIYEEITDTYIIAQVRHGKYVQQKGNGYEYVFNERTGEESLLNLFIHADEMANRNPVELTIRGYQLSDKFTLPLAKLCAYMKAERSLGYMGLEEETKDTYTGTVFYVNRDLMYKHLVYFTFPKEAFKNNNAVIEATVYPYIPINNIQDLYDDMRSTRDQFLSPQN